MKPYIPSQKILEKYADVLVNFALNSGKGIQKGDVVRLSVPDAAKLLYFELYKAVTKAGGHVIPNYYPSEINRKLGASRIFFEHAEDHQIDYFPDDYYTGLSKQMDHAVSIIADTDKKALQGIDPKKMMRRGVAVKKFSQLLNKKENVGKFTWTIGLFGTRAGAREAGLSEKEYWDQITKACFLNEKDPVKKWKEVYRKIGATQKKLNALKIERLHLVGPDIDLHIKLGEKRKWAGGSGRNIPSFELFTSPDWRGTEGWVRFNQPLYRYGNLITGIELWFEKGRVVKCRAKKNEQVLKEMIATENADKVGEFSLTDRRFSNITKFMAETLFDENIGGPFGNTHIALGSSYHDCYEGDPSKVSKKGWAKLGFNDSSVHTDIISTTDRTVTATLKGGKKKVIYKDGEFVI